MHGVSPKGLVSTVLYSFILYTTRRVMTTFTTTLYITHIIAKEMGKEELLGLRWTTDPAAALPSTYTDLSFEKNHHVKAGDTSNPKRILPLSRTQPV